MSRLEQTASSSGMIVFRINFNELEDREALSRLFGQDFHRPLRDPLPTDVGSVVPFSCDGWQESRDGGHGAGDQETGVDDLVGRNERVEFGQGHRNEPHLFGGVFGLGAALLCHGAGEEVDGPR